MRKAVLSIFSVLLVSLVGSAQTTYDIEAGGGPSGPAPYYSPQFLTIQVGDIVRWTNSGGTHNVDGTLETFPENPEGFTNGPPSSVLWEFEHTFTIPGFYEFECAAFDHNETQFGNITVVGVGLNEEDAVLVEFYPNPVIDQLNIASQKGIETISVLTLDLKLLEQFEFSGSQFNESVYIGELKAGSYLVEVTSDDQNAMIRIIKE